MVFFSRKEIPKFLAAPVKVKILNLEYRTLKNVGYRFVEVAAILCGVLPKGLR